MAPPGSTASSRPNQQTVQILTAALGGGLVLVMAISPLVASTGPAPLWAYALLVAACGATILLSATTLGRIAPLPPGPAEDSAWALVLPVHLVRVILLELPGFLGFVLAVLLDSMWPALVGCGLAVASILILAWPSQRVLAAYEERLNARGARARLS